LGIPQGGTHAGRTATSAAGSAKGQPSMLEAPARRRATGLQNAKFVRRRARNSVPCRARLGKNTCFYVAMLKPRPFRVRRAVWIPVREPGPGPGRALPQSHALKRKQRNKRAASAIPIGKGRAQLARLGQVPQRGPPRRQSARRGRRSARSVAQLAKLGQVPPVAGPPDRRSDRRRRRSTRGV